MGAVADVQAYLVAQGLVDGSTGWPSVRRRIHDGTDKLVVITEDGGAPPTVKATTGVGSAALKDPAVQVLVRAEEWDGDAANTKAEAIFAALHSASGTIGAGNYLRVAARTAGPIFVGFDEQGRPIHTISFKMLTSV